MNAPGAQGPRPRRDRVRYQARLDAETSAKIEEFAAAFHRKRSAILRCVMDWGLTQTQGWGIDRSIPATVQTIGMLVEPDLLQQGQEAAAVHGTSVAVWLRHALRQVTHGDFPSSWRAGETSIRSHDSSRDGRRFMLRLDQETSAKLQTLTQGLDRPAAAIIRQLIAHAVLEDFPESWHMAVKARQQRQKRS